MAGRAAGAVWAVGLVVGLSALATGYPLVASVTLLVAVLAPWFGLAVVLHSKPRVFDSEPRWQIAPAPVPSGGYRIRLPAR